MPYTFNSAIGYVQRDLDGSTLELFGTEVFNSSQTPQVWLNVFCFEQHGGVVVQFDSVDGLFPDGMIPAMVAGYRSLLEQLLDATAWSQHTFDLLAADQKQRRAMANDTADADAGHRRALRRPARPAAAHARRGGDHHQRLHDELCRAAPARLARRGVAAGATGRPQRTGRPGHAPGSRADHRHPGHHHGGRRLPARRRLLPAQRQNYMLTDGRVRCVLTNVDWQDTSGLGLQLLGLDATRPVAGVQTTRR